MLQHWFANPVYLWLALALLPPAVWDAWRRWGSSRDRQLFAVAVRTLLLLSLVVALAGPKIMQKRETAEVIFLVDRSASIPEVALQDALARVESFWAALAPQERAGLVLFDDRPWVAVHPGDEWSLPPVLRDEPVAETDLGLALQVALGLIPEGHLGRIVLFSDGRPTRSDGDLGLAAARERGVPIFTVVIEPGAFDPSVVSINPIRQRVRPAETVGGEILVQSGLEELVGRIRITLEKQVILERALRIPPGERHAIPFESPLDEGVQPGLARLRAELLLEEGLADSQPANNSAVVGIRVDVPPQVLIIARDPAEVTHLSQVLKAERMEVEIRPLAELAAVRPDLSAVDLVVLGNVPAVATEEGEPVLDGGTIQALRRYVSSGGGLVVLGGDRSYELGGYGGTELAALLPVELRPRDPELQPAAAMIIILDNSGSMDTWVEGGTKMDLANLASVAAMLLLRPVDRLGVMAVDDRVDWVVPIQEVLQPEQTERSIRGIQAGGGGIYVYTALREAFRTMRNQDLPLRHVILFADAADSEEQVSGVPFGWGSGPNSYDLARAMRMEGITVSVIGIGMPTDVDANFLRQLAEAGGGRHYLTARASDLEALFVQETQRLLDSVLHEAPFRVRVQEEHPAMDGIEFRRSPLLGGFIQLEARATAQVSMTSPEGYPVMTTWQYGLGQVAAMGFDAGPRWSAQWLSWEGYPRFWTQLARWGLRRREGDDTVMEVRFEQGQAHLQLARRSREGLTELEGGMTGSVREIGAGGVQIGEERAISLEVVEPGLWESRLMTEPGRSYQVIVADASGEVFGEHSFVSPSSGEFGYRQADRELLLDLAARSGGVMSPEVGEIGGSMAELEEVRLLWPVFLWAALLLMPLDAFLRRPGREW
ncbi:MAG: VWA domain-containing protein [Bradymonadales bacterium]|nr:VWA domain-containing protein [Bradymonadales bacterium]